MSYKAHFAGSVGRAGAPLHFAAHSHHPWPDVTRAAHAQAWADAALHLDAKWDSVFERVLPDARAHIARVLSLPDPQTVVFAPNTHDFVRRILSCLPVDRTPRILTTDAEFYSFARQTSRLAEEGLVAREVIPVEPYATFIDRFVEAARAGGHDLVFFSQVFFNSGFVAPNLTEIVAAVRDEDTLVVVDGYHGFFARETDFSALADRAFYMSGGYKYAMAGEGCCFLHVPPSAPARPRDTGWFAAFGALSATQEGQAAYAPGGARFFGATFDPTALYRLNAVLAWAAALPLSVATADEHCRALQRLFVGELAGRGGPLSEATLLFDPNRYETARFLVFETPDAEAVEAGLKAAGVMIDRRGDRLRFGFGVYHDPEDVALLRERLLALT